MKPVVSLRAVADYERSNIGEGLQRLLEPLGGISAFVGKGQRVLIKPNMLSGKDPDKAVTTHPELVRAVICQVIDAGGIPLVGDSPGIGTPKQVARSCGIAAVIEETGATFAPFTESVPASSASGIFHKLELARDVLDADVVINLPKLKTHQMMGLTCGVKNLFGAVVGMRKPQLHLQAGTDKAFFAHMLLELCDAIAPALTIVDAVTAMEGEGPGSGDPVHVGVLLASADPVALDTVATCLVGLPQEAVWTQKVAREQGRPGSDLSGLQMVGDSLGALRPAVFRPAKSTDVNFGLPDWVRGPLRQAVTATPAVDDELCLACGLCARHCPPEAMSIEEGRLQIDYKRCIRCFCCQELCPHEALRTRQGLLLRLARFLGGKP